jgi:hypothetical protein
MKTTYELDSGIIVDFEEENDYFVINISRMLKRMNAQHESGEPRQVVTIQPIIRLSVTPNEAKILAGTIMNEVYALEQRQFNLNSGNYQMAQMAVDHGSLGPSR